MNPIAKWLEGAVIGLDLCPFANLVWSSGLVRIVYSDATDRDAAVHDALDEAVALLETHPLEVATTLVGYTAALADFDEFLGAVGAVQETLSEAGADGILQVASFHPRFRFDGSGEDDIGNFTNRSPVPVIHLLREDDVSRAIDSHTDIEGVPAANVARLDELGIDLIRKLWSQWSLPTGRS